MSEDLKELEGKRKATDLLAFRDSADALFFLRSLLADPFNMPLLRAALAEAHFGLDVSVLGDDQVLEQLAHVLLSGRLRIGSVPLPVAPVGLTTTGDQTAEQEPQVLATPVTEDHLSWIAVQLVDMEGNPIPDRAYKIELPNGKVEEGNLDANGEMRLSAVEVGDCQLTLTDLDESAWEYLS